MNPAKALASLVRPPGGEPAAPEAALRAWRDLFAPHADVGAAVATTGVRPALRALFAHLSAAEWELGLPEDVYPEYRRLAEEAGLRCRSFVTLPTPDFSALPRSGRVTALLPQPLAPLGRYLTAEEAAQLRAWLADNPGRRVIFDTAYHFDHTLDTAVRSLWEAGQAYVVHSLVKGWLLPDTLGVTLAPAGEAEALRRRSVPLAPEAAGRAAQALGHHPDLPLRVEATFRRRWAALAGRIRAAIPDWSPPATGYFSVVAVPFEELLTRHGMLAVPASVFGSSRHDYAIMSCLYYPE
jgi:aspartate/methionine/tyrosine aminotransferase